MRLTLRTLLAYLDDTLEPSEIKQIGQKVAESDAAQELIARLKQVTRRRRLTTPPDTAKGESFDPNTVAAYLDNELPSEQVAELEKLCLESDVHLAEVAACHQILTLVLGEPALVPPTAKERMYGLVKGREAIPFRKAPANDLGAEGDSEETDDAMLSVLAFHRQQNGWKRWVLPVAGVILFLALPVVLIAALLQGSNLPRETHPIQVVNIADKNNLDKDANKDAIPPKNSDTSGDKNNDAANPNKDKPSKDNSTTDQTTRDKADKDANKDKPNKDGTGGPGTTLKRPAEPTADREKVATYQGTAKMGAPSILAQHENKADGSWTRVAPNSTVWTADKLVSLPGYTSELTTTSGVRLQLWGTLPRFFQLPPGKSPPPLYESAVILHTTKEFDLDLTLERGRIFLANAKDKGPASVRVRFGKEVWDLTLAEPGSEAAVDVYKVTPANLDWKRDEPLAVANLYLVQGKGGLRVDYQSFPSLSSPGPSLFSWNSYGRGLQGPFEQPAQLAAFGKDVPATKEATDLREGLDGISKRLGEKKPVNVVLQEIMDDGSQTQRSLTIYCLGAIDAMPTLLDILDNKDEARGQDRIDTIGVLMRWVGRGSGHARQLFDYTTGKSGIMIDKKYTAGEAAIMLKLLHYPDELEVREPDTYDTLADYLTHKKMAIRELANLHLINLSRGVKTIPSYNAAWDQTRLDRAAQEWKGMVKRGELPPPAPQPPAPPGGPSGNPPK